MPLERVKCFLENYPDLKIQLFNESTHTADLAAEALGVETGQIAKTLVLLADGKPLLLVTCGDHKVDTKKFAKLLGVKKLKFADATTVYAFTGFSPGGVSPIGSLEPLSVYIDQSLYQYDIVYAAAGTANSALPIRPDRLLQITAGSKINVCFR